MGIVRHVDAGYDEAIEAAERLGVRIPMRDDAMLELRGAAQVLRAPGGRPRPTCATTARAS